MTKVSIPNSVTDIYGKIFESNPNLSYTHYNNADYIGNASNPHLLLVKANSKSIASCTVHNNTKIICEDAFKDCNILESVSIGNSVVSIGDRAFNGCKALSGFTLSSSVKKLGEYSFYNCSKLTEIHYTGTVSDFKNITKGNFGNSFDWRLKVIHCSDGDYDWINY